MKTLFFCCCTILSLIACQLTDESADKAVLAGKVERNLTITIGREFGTGFGEELGEGRGQIQKTDSFLTLRVWRFTSGIRTPQIMRTLMGSIEGQLFKNTLTIGDTWEQTGHRGETEQVTLESYEDVKLANTVYPKCLKHKTVITDANRERYSELEKSLINGTRYLWLSPGLGVVKLRYEHSNGIITEAELIDSHVPIKNDSYFPVNVGTSWTYKWKNDFENKTLVEKLLVIRNENNKNGLAFNSIVTTEDGKEIGDGNFYFYQGDPLIKIRGSGFSYTGRERPEGPTSIFSDNIENLWPELFRYPLTVGKTWTKEGLWNSEVITTIEDYESVQISLGTFKDCLKHKSHFTGATADADATEDTLERIALINGTRYLWFAKGVGLVKMRYEHSNGIITEAELNEYDVPGGSTDYLPLNVGTTWTYKWQNDYQPSPMIEKAVLSDPKVRPETPLKKAAYVITIEDANAPGEMTVDFTLTPEVSSLEKMQLRLEGDSDYIPQHGQYMPEGDKGYHLDRDRQYAVRGVNIEGRWTRQPHFNKTFYPNWKIDFFPHEKFPITLNYEISRKYAEDYKAFQVGRYGFETSSATRPYFREDCMLWAGSELFIVGGKADNIEVEFKLPKGWRVLTPWKRIGRTGHRFSVENQEELTTNYLLIGEHTEVVTGSGKTEVVIGMGGNLKASKDEMKRTVEKFLRAYSKLFKDGPDRRVVFIINPSETEHLGGEGQGRDRTVNILMNSTLDEASEHLWAPFLGHEVFHIWNGLTALTPFTSKERWFLEGVTNYYADITAKQIGYLSESEYLERLESACEKYLSVSDEHAIGDDFRDSRLLYEGGSLVAAALDLQIRHLTKNRKNFDLVMQQMYRKFSDNSIEYTQRDIIKTVNKVAGENFDTFFETYVTGKERLPLSEYFDKAGLNVQVTSEELPTSDYVKEVLKTSLQRNMSVEIISINGSRIGSLKKLQKIAKHWGAGEAVTLSFEENGKPVTVTTTLKGVSDNPPTESEIVVHITKQAKTTKLQRAILAGILGEK
jgi:predicted metalloprotease with PDZ domain